MAFLSTAQSQAKSSLKLKMSSKKVILALLVITTLLIMSVFSSTTALANSCSKSDIDYYLQKGFTNDQVVLLCAGPSQSSGQQTQDYQAPAQTQQSLQQSQMREDESYLSAALDASSVNLNNQSLTIFPRECIKHGPDIGQAAPDLVEKICINTKLTINLAGMVVGKASRGFFLVKDPKVNVKGNIQRELTGLSELRRQDREALLSKMSKNPKAVNIKIRRGIDPIIVAQRLSKYSR